MTAMFFFLSSSGFGQAVKDPLEGSPIGRWETDLAGVKGSMKSGAGNGYDSLPSQAKAQIDRSISSRVFIFLKDGGFEASWELEGSKNMVKGVWVLGEKNSLSIEISTTEKSTYRIIFSGRDRMVLVPEGIPRGLVRELHFVRKDII